MASHHQQTPAGSSHNSASRSGSRQLKGVHDYSSQRNSVKDDRVQSIGQLEKLISKQLRANNLTSHRQQHSLQVINSKTAKQSNPAFNPIQLLHSQLQHQVSQSPPRQETGRSGSREEVVVRRPQSRRISTGSSGQHQTASSGRYQPVLDSNGTGQPQVAAHRQRSKFQGSFLASHNTKSKAATHAQNLSVSPNNQAHHQNDQSTSAKPILVTNNCQVPPSMKLQSKSPIAISNPSTFTITTTQNNMLFNSNSPNNVGSSGSNGNRFSGSGPGSNPSSVRHNSTKQSDVLMNTDQSSSLKQRENIKVFSVKPSNLKVHATQLNVTSLKTSQISLAKEHQPSLAIKAKTRVPTVAHPSPTAVIGKEVKLQLNKARNRSSGNGEVLDLSSQQQLQQQNTAVRQNGSSDGTVSNESKRQSIIMQPNIVKKPLMGYQHDSMQAEDYSSLPQQPQLSRRASKKASQPQTLRTSTQTNRNSQPSVEKQTAQAADSTPNPQSTSKKFKIRKRGLSENTHTEASSCKQRALKAGLLLNSQTSSLVLQSGHKPVKSQQESQFQQRGNSLPLHQPIPSSESTEKLGALAKQTKIPNDKPTQAQRERQIQFDHKEVIVNHIRKYIKLKPEETKSREMQEEKKELIVQNLRDFLTYLESKNIINPQKLQNQDEMQNFIKDIMKLDLSKFSKPRSSSTGQQPRQAKNGDTGPPLEIVQQQKKRKVLPSPATQGQIESRTAPTQFSNPTNQSQTSIPNFAKVNEGLSDNRLSHAEKLLKAQSRTKHTSVETSTSLNPTQVKSPGLKFEYSSQPKYLNYGNMVPKQKPAKTSGHSRDSNNTDPDKAHTSESRINLSSVNFVLPSNRTVNRNDQKAIAKLGNPDVYGVQSMQVSLLQSTSINHSHSPEQHLKAGISRSSQQRNDTTRSQAETNSVQSGQNPLLKMSLQPKTIKVDREVKTLKVKHQPGIRDQINQDTIAVEEQLQQMQQMSQKPRLYSGRGPKVVTVPKTTQQSPSSRRVQSSDLSSHQKVLSQPNLADLNNSSNLMGNGNAQQVPTIQLMINTNGQGKFLGINVNNYCFAPSAIPAQTDQSSELQSRHLHQLLQMQNNSSAEQLHRSQLSVGQTAKQYQAGVKTEPDQFMVEPLQAVNFSAAVARNLNLKCSSIQKVNASNLSDQSKQSQNGAQLSAGLLHSRVQQIGKGFVPASESTEFQIIADSKGGSYFDQHIDQRKEQSQAGPKYVSSSKPTAVKPKGQKGRESREMVIQDDDDDNTGGNGAEAKMSPTAQSAHGNSTVFHANKQLQQSAHYDTPLVAKLQGLSKQTSSSLRKGSERSSQRTSSINQALDIASSQIKAAGISGSKPLLQKPSKECSQEKQITSSETLMVSQKMRQPEPTAKNSPCRATGSNVILNDPVTEDRDKLIRYIKAYVRKHGKIPHTTLDFYKFVKLLGKGAFGKITLGIHKLTGKYVAIKSIDKVNIKDEYSRRKVFQEVYILKKIRHSCVIRLLEVFESEKHFLMVMEYSGGGDLLQYVKKRKRLNEQSAKAIFKQILYALGHCHCRSVLHRDIKLDNVLMDGEGGVKLCDFGVSRIVKKGNTINEQCGTPAYLAPEIIIDKGYQGFSADVWSLGVLLYAMVQGTVPFKAQNIADLHKLILKGDFEFPVDTVSDEVKDLVRRMLVLDPTMRISIPQMLNHPWVADFQRELGESSGIEDSQHDLRVGSTFFREEVLGGLISGCQSDGNENGNINFVNVENLYYRGGPAPKVMSTNQDEKVTYSDYCALTEDFMTYRIDEEAMDLVTSFGYPRDLVLESINRGDVNHATTAYYLLVY